MWGKKFPIVTLLILFIILHTIIITGTPLLSTEDFPVVARITDITWDLETLYQEFQTFDAIINCTVVYFTVDLEIWNRKNINQSVPWSSCCEFPLNVTADLVDLSLNFTEWYGCCCLFWYATYSPGLTRKTVSFPFAYEKPNLTELAQGVYRVDFYAAIPTFGLDITVSESNTSIVYVIEYDPFPDNWGVVEEDVYISSESITDMTTQLIQSTSKFISHSSKNIGASTSVSSHSSNSLIPFRTPLDLLPILPIAELSTFLLFVVTLIIVIRRYR
jgi:hypothetical protein